MRTVRNSLRLLAIVACAALPGCDQAPAPAAQTRLQAEPRASEATVEPQAAESTAREGGAQDGARRAEPSLAAPPAESVAIRDLTFDDLKFEMEKTDPFERAMLTPEIEALVGQRIRIRGYIRPTAFQTGITQFVLVRDNLECCFGPGAWLYDCVLVEMNSGKSTDYTVRPIAVEGIFEVREFLGPDGKHLAIYHLQGEQVE